VNAIIALVSRSSTPKNRRLRCFSRDFGPDRSVEANTKRARNVIGVAPGGNSAVVIEWAIGWEEIKIGEPVSRVKI
jgi:hypothetical protein